jgi:hypothetical protein
MERVSEKSRKRRKDGAEMAVCAGGCGGMEVGLAELVPPVEGRGENFLVNVKRREKA